MRATGRGRRADGGSSGGRTPLALVAWQREDAREVVLLRRVLLLREVADHVRARVVHLADDVEEEGLDVVVERLVVEEELGEEAEVLAEDALVLGVDLEDRDVVRRRLLAVDLVARLVERLALGR